MPNESSDRNLLFGILAVQMDFITRDALVTAMHAWVLNKSKPLGAILVEQKTLSPDRHALLQALVQEHIKQHHNDPQQSLAAVSSVASVKKVLEQIADPDVQASILPLASRAALTPGENSDDPFATTGVGASTSTGVRFRILRPHAKGGLGEVFVAQDEELHREVALKEIQNRHADNRESRARFMLEAEITGGLEHPGIVPVYGLGQYADGRPFYAMRFIRGDSLQDAIERFHKADIPGRDPGERALELRKLLGRFIDVCQAMQYAHDRGVLHRDLKPGNIMLGKYGETLVVDWGLAKASGKARDWEASSTIADEPALKLGSASANADTVAGAAIGTPAYMSPEQAAGRLDLLGPASDVYSLGATLYALLTGKPSVEDRDLGVVLNKVQRGDIPRPRQVQPLIHPSLEAICVKAMALNPAHRYESPEKLSEDLEHWLADEPVEAWQEPWLVKVRRWIGRHRTLVTAAVVASLVGIVSLGIATLLLGWKNADLIKANEAEQQAREEAVAREKEVTKLNVDLTRANVAEKKATEQAVAQTKIAASQRKVAEEERGRAKVEAERAVAVSRFLVSMFESSDPLGISGFSYGIPKATGEKLTAREVLDRGALRIKHDRDLTAFDRAALLDSIGNVYRSIGQHEQARDLLQESIDLRSKSSDAGSLDLAASLHSMGWLLHERGDYDEALKLYRRALKIRQSQPIPDEKLISSSMINQAWLLTEMREHAEAEAIFKELIKLRRRVYGDDHRETAVAQIAMASLYFDSDRFLEGIPLAKEGLDALLKVEGNASLAKAIGKFQDGVVQSFVFKNHAGAEKSLAECAELSKRDLGDRHIYTALALYQLGQAQLSQGKWVAAESTLTEAIDIARFRTGLAHPRAAVAVESLTTVLKKRGKTAAAIQLNQEVLTAQTDKYGPDSFLRAQSLLSLAALFENSNLKRLAVAQAVAILRKQPAGRPRLANSFNSAGFIYFRERAWPEAASCYRDALRLDPKNAVINDNLADALHELGLFSEAIEYYQTAMDLLPTNDRRRIEIERDRKKSQHHLALEGRLASVIDKKTSATAAELLELADLCRQFKHRYTTAVDLYRSAFKVEPALANTQHRYHAARAATVASTGKGEASAKLSDDAKIKLRLQAREWLQADLDHCAQQMKVGEFAAATRLAFWQVEADLASVREPKELARLSDEEQQAWQKLWSDVRQLHKDLQSRFIETRYGGALTAKDRSKVHLVKMVAGKLYQIDMESKAFDTFLKLQDAQGKLLAENDDDESNPNTLNSRIVFTPKADGFYRLVATSFQQQGVGAYAITVRAIAAKKE